MVEEESKAVMRFRTRRHDLGYHPYYQSKEDWEVRVPCQTYTTNNDQREVESLKGWCSIRVFDIKGDEIDIFTNHVLAEKV